MAVAPEDLKILATGTGLFEAPRWDGQHAVFFTNVTAGGVHRLDLEDGSVQCVVPHRRGIGGLALTETQDVVVSGRNISLKRMGADADTVTLLDPAEVAADVIGFNDFGVNPEGRLVVGALGPGALSPKTLTGREPPPPEGTGTANVYLQSEGGWTHVAGDIGHTNGIAFSPDGRYAYVSDSLRRLVYRYPVNGGTWGQRIEFARFDAGLPDGMAVAADGSVWVAAALASQIVVLEPDGSVRTRYATPWPLTTSLSFGGADLRTVFVTAGSHDGGTPGTLASFRSPICGIAPIPAAYVPATQRAPGAA